MDRKLISHRHATTAVAALLAVAALTAAPPAAALALGQVDTFEDGTTQGWTANLLGLGTHPAPPRNEADGGPAGAGDGHLRLTSVGGVGQVPGSRLVAINLGQWAGDYSALGLQRIGMDLLNLSTTDLSIRLYLENPRGAPPTDEAVTDAVLLPTGGGWTHVEFDVSESALTLLRGNLQTLLGDVTALRLFHGPAAGFPGPSVVAALGVDNITALPAAVPEPATLALTGLGLALAVLRGRRRVTPA